MYASHWRLDDAEQRGFRVWLAEYPPHWRPAAWNDHPPTALAFAKADPRALSLDEAKTWCRGFNRREMCDPTGLWAILTRIGEEPVPGQPVMISPLPAPSLN